MERHSTSNKGGESEIHFKKLDLTGIDLVDQNTIENIYQVTLSMMYPAIATETKINKVNDSSYCVEISYPLKDKNNTLKTFSVNYNDLSSIFLINPCLINNIELVVSPEEVVLQIEIWKSSTPIKLYTKKKTIIKTVMENSTTHVVKKRKHE
jgi:hypothetical protein